MVSKVFNQRGGVGAVWCFLLVCVGLGMGSAQAWGAGWPLYRGPNGDGVVQEEIRTNWAEKPLRRLWKVPLGPGLSSMSIVDGRVFTQVRRNVAGQDREFCAALRADTGAELWSVDLDVSDHPHGGVGPDDGPRSTPTVDGDRVYVFTSSLRLFCLEAATGRVVWSRDFIFDYGSSLIPWENAASPVVVGDAVLVNCNASDGRLMAVNKRDGSTLWRAHNDRMTQATPVVTRIEGVEQVIFFAQTGLVSVVPATGAVLWRYPFSYSTSTAASPVVVSNVVYCSAAYGRGAAAIRLTRSAAGVFSVQELWKTPGANMNHWATPVHFGGYLYGVYGQSLTSLRCIDLATGREMWRQSGIEEGSVLLASGLIMAFHADGTMVLVRPDPRRYEELARFQAVQGRCWNNASVAGGVLYARSTTEAAAYDIAPEEPVLPTRVVSLVPVLDRSAGQVEIGIRAVDGTALDPAYARRFTVQTSSGAAAGGAGLSWVALPVSMVATNQALVFRVPVEPSGARLFRVIQPVANAASN